MIRRLVFLIPGALALLAGLDAALLLLGVWAPVDAAELPDLHGILMVFGFLGTLIALERSVALAKPLGFIAPALLGLGAIAILTPAPLLVGQIILLAGSLAFTLLYIPLFKRNFDDAVLVQALGAAMLTAAALMWMGGVPVSGLIGWLTGYVVLTIAAERLELARMSISGPAVALFRLLVALFVLALLTSLLWPAIGMPVLGAALLALVAWLLINDVARRTWRAPGQPGFIGVCLMAGYVWLAVAGLIWVLGGVPTSTRAMDATIHSVFLGFAISMIMAHASVILPAVLRIRLPYHRGFYVPAALLHASLILRIGLGDGLDLAWALRWGGVFNVIALLGFAGLAATSAITATRAKAKSAAKKSTGTKRVGAAATKPTKATPTKATPTTANPTTKATPTTANPTATKPATTTPTTTDKGTATGQAKNSTASAQEDSNS